MKKHRIFFVSVLIVCLLFVSLSYFVKPADAIVPALVLTPMIKAYIGAALVAAGMTFTTHSQINNAAGALWESIADTTKNALTWTVNTQSAIESSTLSTVGQIVSLFHNDVVINNKPISVNTFWDSSFPNTVNRMTLTNNAANLPAAWSVSTVVGNFNLGDFLINAIPGSSFTIYNTITHRSDSSLIRVNLAGLQWGGTNMSHTASVIRSPGFSIERGATNFFKLELTFNSIGNGLWFWLYLNNVLVSTNFQGTLFTALNELGSTNVLYVHAGQAGHPITGQTAWETGLRTPYVIDSPAVFTPAAGTPQHNAKLPNWKLYVPPAVAALGSAAILDWLLNRTHTDLEAETGVIVSTAAASTPIDLTGTNTLLDTVVSRLTSISNSISQILNPAITTNIDILTPANQMIEKINPLSGTLASLSNFNTARGQPPVFRVNLNSLIAAGSPIHGLSSGFAQSEHILVDFSILENYKLGNVSIIDLIRNLLTFGMLYMTLLYIWRKIQGVI